MEFNVWISIIRFQEQRGEPQRALALRCWQNQSSFPRTTSHHETQSGAGKTSSPSECASPSSRCFTRLNSLCFPPQTKAETFKGRNSDPVFVFLCFIYIHSLFNGNYDSYFERVMNRKSSTKNEPPTYCEINDEPERSNRETLECLSLCSSVIIISMSMKS